MKSAPSVYYAPKTVEEVYSLLSQYSDEAKILAGGQSLFPVMAQPSMLIDINQVHVLDEIPPDERGVAIGALTYHRTAERSGAVHGQVPSWRLPLSGSDIPRFAIAALSAAAWPMLVRRRNFPCWQPSSVPLSVSRMATVRNALSKGTPNSRYVRQSIHRSPLREVRMEIEYTEVLSS
jgi:hypothetical protein